MSEDCHVTDNELPCDHAWTVHGVCQICGHQERVRVAPPPPETEPCLCGICPRHRGKR